MGVSRDTACVKLLGGTVVMAREALLGEKRWAWLILFLRETQELRFAGTIWVNVLGLARLHNLEGTISTARAGYLGVAPDYDSFSFFGCHCLDDSRVPHEILGSVLATARAFFSGAAY